MSARFPSLLRTLAALAPLLLASACGGGFYFGAHSSSGFGDDTSPTVSLASVSTVQAGQELTLVAAASDAEGIDNVTFYSVENGTSTVIGSDVSAPYELTLTAPTGSTELVVFARATDNSGNTADSASITITVTP